VTISRRLAAISLASLALLAPAASARAAGVFVVGDSLEVGTSPYLGRYLPGVSIHVDAKESRPSGDAVQVLRAGLRPSDSVIVFDAGVNDDPSQPQALAADLRAVGAIAGGRCVVVATVSRPPYNGVGPQGLNGAITSFATSRPNTQLVEWRAAALANPGMLNSDGVHPTPSGYAMRAQLVAQGIRACLTGAPATASQPPPSGAPALPATPPSVPPVVSRAAQRENRRAREAGLALQAAFPGWAGRLTEPRALPLLLLAVAF
jgi:hypothetical protein